MGGSLWTHSETVYVIDCLHEARRLDTWTSEELTELTKQLQRKLEDSGSPPRTLRSIYRRIQHLGKSWTTTDKSDDLALFKYGWESLREECSRSVLLSDPTGRYMHKTILQPPASSSSFRRSRSPEKRYVKLANSVDEFNLRDNQAPDNRGSDTIGHVFLTPLKDSACTMRSYSICACLTIFRTTAVLFTYQRNCATTLFITIFIGSLRKLGSSKVSRTQYTNRRYPKISPGP